MKDDQLGQFVDATQGVKLTDITNEKLTLAQYVERTATERAGEEMARLLQGRGSEAGSTAGTTSNLTTLQQRLTVRPDLP